MYSFAESFLSETMHVAGSIDCDVVENMADHLVVARGRGSRVFIAGLGGSAANATHMAADLRKLCEIEAYAVTDNVAELTARANDGGWGDAFDTRFWRPYDILFVLSVGGGVEGVSAPLVIAIQTARATGMLVLGIVGRDGGYTKEHGHCVLVVPTVNAEHVTPHTEAFQAVIWHLLVSHPKLKRGKTKW
jgi:D-sedoheptulose 7-phosphate isomerase